MCGLCSKFIYFLANQKNTFANLWRTPRLSFAGVSCLNVSLNLSPKNNVLPRTQKKTLAVSHVETRRPWQLKTLTWTFRTTSIYTARHMHIPTSSTYVKFCPFRFRQSDKFSLDCWKTPFTKKRRFSVFYTMPASTPTSSNPGWPKRYPWFPTSCIYKECEALLLRSNGVQSDPAFSMQHSKRSQKPFLASDCLDSLLSVHPRHYA